jgi:hypothetical protein
VVPKRKTTTHKKRPAPKKGQESLQRLTPLPLKATISELRAKITKVIKREVRAPTGITKINTLGIWELKYAMIESIGMSWLKNSEIFSIKSATKYIDRKPTTHQPKWRKKSEMR